MVFMYIVLQEKGSSEVFISVVDVYIAKVDVFVLFSEHAH